MITKEESSNNLAAVTPTQMDRLPSPSVKPVRHIEASKNVSLGMKELWDYRGLIYFLVWRDIKVRYKQTVMGASWALLQPFFTMVIFSLFFGKLAQVPSDGIPYPIFSYAALVPWMFFANGLQNSSNSLVSNVEMLKKVYFPRLTMPLSAIIAGLLDFGIAFGLLLVMMLYFHIIPNTNIIWIPFFLLLAVITVFGAGFWLSALNVQYRDVRYIVPFLVQAWMFATPIAYPSSLVPEPWRALFGINPMAGVIEGFRWALLGVDTRPSPIILVSFFVSVALFISGMYYFRKMEKTFADVA